MTKKRVVQSAQDERRAVNITGIANSTPEHDGLANAVNITNFVVDVNEAFKAQSKIIVNVRYSDGYLETFHCTQVRQGGEILWMRLTNGQNRTIPLMRVRWFSTDPESHASEEAM